MNLGLKAVTWVNKVLKAIFGPASIGRYGLFGLSGLAVDMATYVALILVGVFPVVATVVSSLLAILTNYIANAVFNFRVRPHKRQAMKYLVVGVIGLVVSAIALHTALLLGTGVWWAKVISLALVVPAQFVTNASWTFRS